MDPSIKSSRIQTSHAHARRAVVVRRHPCGTAEPTALHSTPLATPCDLSLLLLPAAVRLHPHVVRRFFSHRVGASMRRARGTEGVRYG
uniref:Uncharacterized protein n=1 Tax=Oryza sativa subsp. japonica TaxID=39947 RepID=Q6EQ18_ORYSJ|nr:hypothetical protein [Oryza sativa Japonica Group]BAD29252.1 hypothetical protein [Oryza sativa Japonica Group]